jgi:hypothetical protein
MSSRLVPFVALREIQSVFGLKWPGPQKAQLAAGAAREDFIRHWIDPEALAIHDTRDPDEVVSRTVKAIEKLQNHDGGFKYWSSSSCSADFGSAYAMLALGRAKEVGYEVDDVLAKGRRFLEEKAVGRCTSCTWSCYGPDDTTRVFALYTLARQKTPKASVYPELFARRDKLPLFGKAMLADAMFDVHRRW